MGGDVLVRVVIPAVVVFCMAVVGLDLTLEDFRRIRRHPRLVGVGVLGPVLLADGPSTRTCRCRGRFSGLAFTSDW